MIMKQPSAREWYRDRCVDRRLAHFSRRASGFTPFWNDPNRGARFEGGASRANGEVPAREPADETPHTGEDSSPLGIWRLEGNRGTDRTTEGGLLKEILT